ncbi:SMP-30/gluconolactonase/LRE family protein [Mesobaculum littorinae]|uniref:SMP-30/gluconolactonase/LRE family protein n=1 Tax=Mesobaculum littorinae TaxID=2486419 RepID=A0A438AJ68_9RHOB|nr:SMP-30/gluconolactonase/LRE family protein [Mesobaculum littorinae]RVV98704.1 SMP-30/gluconolactonase/LRE family protein [Mesobaculum littorinae]
MTDVPHDTAADRFDARPCQLGEGLLWHPGRAQLFWVDILSSRLMWHGPDGPGHRDMDEMISAMGIVDDSRMVVASETRLFVLDLDSGTETLLCPLEADDPETRSNDGRADPLGGFWIGTMSKEADTGRGAIYRWHRGELRKLFGGISIPNAICFAPDGAHAYFTDTRAQIIWRQPLDAQGWPEGGRETFLDLTGTARKPDGAVTDAVGNLWVAEYEGARVACHAPDGALLHTVSCAAAPLATCPAFGGPDLTTLFCTTAGGDGSGTEQARPGPGQTFELRNAGQGRPEPRVRLD